MDFAPIHFKIEGKSKCFSIKAVIAVKLNVFKEKYEGKNASKASIIIIEHPFKQGENIKTLKHLGGNIECRDKSS